MRIWRWVAVIGFAVLIPVPLVAQTSALHVSVRLRETNVPIPGVLLMLRSVDSSQAQQAQDHEKPDERALLAFLARVAILSKPVLTNAQGIAAFQGLPPGSYRVDAHLDGYLGIAEDGSAVPAAASSTIDVGSEPLTVEVLLRLDPAPSISGRIRDANGAPVPNACVDLGTLGFQDAHVIFASGPTSFTDADGVYSLQAGGPGDYSIRVRSPASPPIVYYPGDPDLEKAMPISLGTAQQATGVDLFLTASNRSNRLPDLLELIRLSDFVGFVFVDSIDVAPLHDANWRQLISLKEVDAIKGSLTRVPSNSGYSRILADSVSSSGYPGWFSGKGEYLVFLGRSGNDGALPWIATAVLQVRYRPDPSGRIVGTLFGESRSQQGMSVLQVRHILEEGGVDDPANSDLQLLDTLLQDAAASQCAPDGPRKTVSAEERLREVQQLAATIKFGTTRADVEKMFPQSEICMNDCFTSGNSYYVAPEVKVEVPYDSTGGFWNAANRVNGPIKVYR